MPTRLVVSLDLALPVDPSDDPAYATTMLAQIRHLLATGYGVEIKHIAGWVTEEVYDEPADDDGPSDLEHDPTDDHDDSLTCTQCGSHDCASKGGRAVCWNCGHTDEAYTFETQDVPFKYGTDMATLDHWTLGQMGWQDKGEPSEPQD